MSTAAFILAALALSWLIVGWFRRRWDAKATSLWGEEVRVALASMTREERREWRMWWLKDARAAEAWLSRETGRRISGLQ